MSSSKWSTLFAFGVMSKSSRKQSGDGDNENESKGEQRKKQKNRIWSQKDAPVPGVMAGRIPLCTIWQGEATEVSTNNNAFHKWIRDGTIVAYEVYDIHYLKQSIWKLIWKNIWLSKNGFIPIWLNLSIFQAWVDHPDIAYKISFIVQTLWLVPETDPLGTSDLRSTSVLCSSWACWSQSSQCPYATAVASPACNTLYDQLEIPINTAYENAKSEMPFTAFPSLVWIQTKNGVDLDRNYHTDNACRKFVDVMYAERSQQFLIDILDARYIGILVYSATDSSTKNLASVFVRVLKYGKPKNWFVAIQDIQKCDALGHIGAINAALSDFGALNWK